MAKLFLQILNMSISATYLILAIVILRLFMKKAPKWVNVLLWGLVAVRLLCPFTMESMFSLIPKAQAVSPEIITQDAPDVGGVQVEMGEAGDVSVWLPDVGGTDIGVDPLPPAPVQEAPDPQSLITVLAVVWAVGVLAMVIYMGLSYQTVARRVSTAFPAGEQVYESENIDSAFVLGLFRPKIYLPFALDQKKKDHIRAHEQAHIRRRDHLWKPMGFLLLAVHWFNPFMWVSYVLLCRDIELACDEKVIGDLGRMERAEYSETLLSCSVNRQKKMVYPLAFGEFDMKGRVKAVLNYKKPTLLILCLSLISCVTLAACFLTDPITDNSDDLQTNESTESILENTDESISEPIVYLKYTPDASNAEKYQAQLPGEYLEYQTLVATKHQYLQTINEFAILEKEADFATWGADDNAIKKLTRVDTSRYILLGFRIKATASDDFVLDALLQKDGNLIVIFASQRTIEGNTPDEGNQSFILMVPREHWNFDKNNVKVSYSVLCVNRPDETPYYHRDFSVQFPKYQSLN